MTFLKSFITIDQFMQKLLGVKSYITRPPSTSSG